jgi:hypothetical protein
MRSVDWNVITKFHFEVWEYLARSHSLSWVRPSGMAPGANRGWDRRRPSPDVPVWGDDKDLVAKMHFRTRYVEVTGFEMFEPLLMRWQAAKSIRTMPLPH